MTKEKALVIKFGGSQSVIDSGANIQYLADFFLSLGVPFLSSFQRLGLVIGGGKRSRQEQEKVTGDREKDMVARFTLWEHAESLMRVAKFVGLSVDERIPHSVEEMYTVLTTQQKTTLAMNWVTPGRSTDAAAMMLGEYWAKEGMDTTVAILSNVSHIYTGDPKEQVDAMPILRSNVHELVRKGVLINDPNQFVPGMNVTIDPVAVGILQSLERYKTQLYFGHASIPHGLLLFLQGTPDDSSTVLSFDEQSIVFKDIK